MSGPVLADDVPPESASTEAPALALEITPSRLTEVGGHTIARALPQRSRRTVGAWCFADHLTPTSATIGIGPHPHTGLHTVTWLVAGEMLHRDSLGSEQLIRPGQLNLMTAGHGVVHAEETPPGFRGERHGLQLWVAQPEVTRHGPPTFEHHADLPRAEFGHATVSVLIGAVAGIDASPARADTELVGVDLELRPGRSELPLRAAFEHAVVVLSGEVEIAGTRRIGPAQLGYLGLGRDEIELRTDEPARLVLLGGLPFDETLSMWWNFVARGHDEITESYRAWRAADERRFGAVSSPLERIDAPRPPWLRD